jgi:hypothetical protein
MSKVDLKEAQQKDDIIQKGMEAIQQDTWLNDREKNSELS